MFGSVCKEYFGRNVYITLNEFIFHMMSIFVLVWRRGLAVIRENIDWILNTIDRNEKGNTP